MAKPSLRDRFEEGLEEQAKWEYEQRDKSGNFKGIFREGVSLPFWKVTDGEHCIDHVPYFAGPNHPLVRRKRDAKPVGANVLGLDIWIHRNIGIQQNTYICMLSTYGEPCPICEYRQTLMKKDDKSLDQEIKDLKPSRRYIFNIVCRDNPREEAKGVQLWDVSQYTYHKPLTEAAKLPRGGGQILFQSPSRGKSVCFDAKNVSNKAQEFVSFNFIDRESPLEDEFLEKVICIDEFLEIPTYDELYEVFMQGVNAPSPKEEEEEPLPEEGRPVTGRPSVSKPPASPVTKRETKPVVPKEEPEPEEDVPDPSECPYGGEFGADHGNYEECDGCPVWDACALASEGSAEEEPEPEPPKKPTPKPTPKLRRGNK